MPARVPSGAGVRALLMALRQHQLPVRDKTEAPAMTRGSAVARICGRDPFEQ